MTASTAVDHADVLRHDPVDALCDQLFDQLVMDDEVEDLPDPEPLVEGWLNLDSLAMIYGPSGVGKTFVAFDLAYRVAFGDPWFDSSKITQADAYYVMAEGKGGLKERRRAWNEGYRRGREWPAGSEVAFIPIALDLLDETVAAAFVQLMARQRPKLIVIDTLARTSPGGEEGAKDIGRYISVMDRLRCATGGCVLVVHHTGKDQGRGARGHSALEAAMDTVIEVDGSRVGDVLTVRSTKQKDMPTGTEFALKRVPMAGSVVLELHRGHDPLDPHSKRSKTEQTALDALTEVMVDGGVSASVWKQSLPEGAMADRSFYRARSALLRSGEIVQAGNKYLLATTGEEP